MLSRAKRVIISAQVHFAQNRRDLAYFFKVAGYDPLMHVRWGNIGDRLAQWSKLKNIWTGEKKLFKRFPVKCSQIWAKN